MGVSLAGLIDRLRGRIARRSTERRATRSPIWRGDDWGYAAGRALDAMSAEDGASWLALVAFARTARGSRPSARWLKQAREQVRSVGDARFGELAIAWFGLLGSPPRDGLPAHRALSEGNATVLQGLAWACAALEDDALARAVGDAALACLTKIPEVGARSHRVGNACIWALGHMASIAAVSQLQRLHARVAYGQTRRLIDAAIDAAAGRSGLGRDELDDLAVPTFGLDAGRLRAAFGPYTAEVLVEGAYRVGLHWYAADGAPRKGEPVPVRRSSPDELRTLKQSVRDIRAALAAQRDRLERQLLSERVWALRGWRERYLDHPLLAVLARRLIWHFRAGERAATGAWLAGVLVDANDRPLDWLGEDAQVRLWHPIGFEPTAVLAWRGWLERHEVTQPFKQAHREVYILTDAELRTETYSNRFAAHILRQHQFQALCRQRNWSYQLQGGFDGDSVPTLVLPHWGLAAEFWVEPVFGGEDSMSDAGICLYVTTDQVRFTRLAGGGPVRLVDVPALVFSEVMRDADLFVGVCSIGNDPTWADGGRTNHHTYWRGYAFGDLSASARTRRAVLERLLPRLKIGPRCSLGDRFLVVRGDLRTYKIHLGSGNVLMEPNGQYLCIVPDRGRRGEDRVGRLFLPFEGDGTLAVILSKAFLLADDRKISDSSITRQIAAR